MDSRLRQTEARLKEAEAERSKAAEIGQHLLEQVTRLQANLEEANQVKINALVIHSADPQLKWLSLFYRILFGSYVTTFQNLV